MWAGVGFGVGIRVGSLDGAAVGLALGALVQVLLTMMPDTASPYDVAFHKPTTLDLDTWLGAYTTKL